MIARPSLALYLLTLAGCAGGSVSSSTPEGAQEASASERRLVVLIVVDQLGAEVLQHHLPHLPEDGILRRAHREGSSHVAALPYASTETAPGHATLATGRLPSEHGVVANELFVDGAVRPIVDDGEHEVIGSAGRYAGPGALRAPTVGDLLKSVTGGVARVVSLSLKDRSAVFTAGDRGDLAIFYDDRQGRFTTSTYYAPHGELPTWLTNFNASHPLEERVDVWTPGDRALLEAHFGLDDAAGEARIFDGSRRFPHDPASAASALFRFTPRASEHLLDLSLVAVDALELGRDEVKDLLIVSLSGNDLVGHAFGPHSWEYADNLHRLDRGLARFVSALEARGPVTFVLTADHGVSPLVERLSARGLAAARISPDEVEARARAAAIEAGAPAEWVRAFVPPLLYLDEAVDSRPGLRAAIAHAVAIHPGIHGAYDVRAASALRELEGSVEELVGNSIPALPMGDIYVVPTRNHIFELAELPDAGSSHGTPWDYDRLIPVLLWGAGIEPHRGEEVIDARRVATTLTALLGIASPGGAPVEPIQ